MSTGMLELLRREPPTTDVEICCRFEDVATEGHAHVSFAVFHGVEVWLAASPFPVPLDVASATSRPTCFLR